MEHRSLENYSLNLPSSPSFIEYSNFSLLSDNESDRANAESVSDQINELLARLEAVNEDRHRLKAENERLRAENKSDLFKLLSSQKQDSEKMLSMKDEVTRLRKECEDKENLLNAMRSLLGNNRLSKENLEVKAKKPFQATAVQSRLPGTRALMKTNRSISPYTKCS